MLTDLNPEAFSPIVQAIVYDSALSCLIIGRDGRLSFVNPRLAETLQYDSGCPDEAEYWLRVPAWASGGQPEAGSLRLVMDQVFSGRSWTGELTLTGCQGEASHQQAMLTPIFDSQGQPNGILGILKPYDADTSRHDPAVGHPGLRPAMAIAREKGLPRIATIDDSAALLDVQEGLLNAGHDSLRYEKRLLRFSASYENAAEDLQALLNHEDRVQVRCYLEALEAAADAIGAGQAARLAAEIAQIAASPDTLVPTPVLALFESLMLALQEQILDTLDQRSTTAIPPDLDRRLDAASLDLLMQDLMAYLQNYDLNAIDTFSQLVDGASGVPRYSGIELARPYLESFAFEKALRIVESVWQRTHSGAAAAATQSGRDSGAVGPAAGIRSSRLSRRPPRKRSAMPSDPAADSALGKRTASAMDDATPGLDDWI